MRSLLNEEFQATLHTKLEATPLRPGFFIEKSISAGLMGLPPFSDFLLGCTSCFYASGEGGSQLNFPSLLAGGNRLGGIFGLVICGGERGQKKRARVQKTMNT